MAFHSSEGGFHGNSGSPPAMKRSYSAPPMRSPEPEYSGSSTSITNGFSLRAASARATVPENSRSVIRTLAPPCSSMKAIASASRRVFSVLRTAPAIGTPKWHSSISGVFGTHPRHGAADGYPPARKRRGEPPAACIGLGPAGAARPVDDGDTPWKNVGGALDESQRRQGRVVGRVLVEIELVRTRLACARHRRSTQPYSAVHFHTRSSISTAVSKRCHTHCALFSASISASRRACSASSSALG